MNKNQKGFSSVAVIIILLVLIGSVGWYVFNSTHKNTSPIQNVSSKNVETLKKSSSTKPEQAQPAIEYKRTTITPSDWKTYTDDSHFLSFSYPLGWKVVPDSKGNPDKFDYEIGIGPGSQQYSAIIGLKKQSIESTVSDFGHNYDSKIITSITLDGHQAKEITYKNGGNEEKQYFVYAHDNTYSLPTVFKVDIPGSGELSAKDSLALFESVKIN
jgi:hypothetical protein